MAAISLIEVCKQYDNGFYAVKDFNLEINDGEFIVFVGPSGCGKSTTLRMIAGLEDISSGKVEIGGRIVNDIHPKERDIAMVFQNYALYPHMTVRQNMAFALKLRGFKKEQINERINDVAAMLHLDTLLEHRPKELSGGQRQRVALGRAIVRAPKAFLMDEPLSNLDAALRVEMRSLISQLHRQLGATTVYVTHDQIEAMTMGDRIVVMKAGEIQQVGRPMEIYDKPINKFVASFIGTPAMSFLDGELNNGLISGDGFEIQLSTSLAAKIAKHQGAAISIGLRPENFKLLSGSEFGQTTNSISAHIETIEPLGSETIIRIRIGEKQIMVAKISPRVMVQLDQKIEISFDESNLHLFDKVTEMNIALNV